MYSKQEDNARLVFSGKLYSWVQCKLGQGVNAVVQSLQNIVRGK